MIRINDNGIERDMTPQEEADYKSWALVAQQEAIAEATAKDERLAAVESARKKLAAIGLTEAEITALLGV